MNDLDRISQQKLKILIYCSDTNGMGNTSRTLSIASHISENVGNCAILLLTDLQIIGRYKCPSNMDFVHVPGISRDDQDNYHPRNLNIALKNTLTLRRKIAKSAIKTFKPDVILIQCNPADLPHEMEQTFGFVKHRFPDTRVIWGIPDIMGNPRMVIEDWRQKNVYQMLDSVCDELWIHGMQQIFDVAKEYEFPVSLAQKMYYTGYMRAPHVTRRRIRKDLPELNLQNPFVLVTTGSGTDGYPLIDAYLQFLENAENPLPFQSVIVTGPMMPTHLKLLLMERAQQIPGVVFHRYTKNILQYLKFAQLVVCHGGFNLFCEILTYGKKSIFVPTHTPNHEHFYRSTVFGDLGLIDCILPQTLSYKLLGQKVMTSLTGKNGTSHHHKTPRLKQDGLTRIVERLRQFMPVSV